MTSESTSVRPVTIDALGDEPIQLVTFDLYDTLIELQPRRWERLHAALAMHGVTADLERLKIGDVAGEDYYTTENGRWPIRDRTRPEQHAFRLEHTRRWLEASGVSLSADDVAAVLTSYRGEVDVHAAGIAYQPFDEVVPTLVRLREAGVKRAIISNADADVTATCTRLAFAHEMDAIITSALVGWEKPDPRTFFAALEHPAIQVEPRFAIHVGDQPKSDVVGAIGVGMRAALIDRFDRHVDDPRAVRVRSLMDLAAAVVRHNARLAGHSGGEWSGV